MPIIDMNKVIGVWKKEDIRNWGFQEKTQLIGLLMASLERDYDESQRRAP